jgi:hypothetical protein
VDHLSLQRQTKFNSVLAMHSAVICIRTSLIPIASLLTPQIHRFHCPFSILTSSSKCAGPVRGEELFLACFRHTMRQRELQVLRNELLDVRAFDLVRSEFGDIENLKVIRLAAIPTISRNRRTPTWIDLNLARCLAAISW